MFLVVLGELSEVKGIWFVTARRYLLERHPRLYPEVLAAMPSAHRDAMAEPLTSRWYPEETMRAALSAVSEIVARGDRSRMLAMFDGCTELGVNHFFRIALRLTSTQFALRLLPTMWDRLRRGPGRLAVTVGPRSATIDYSSFPYFDDVNYRLLVEGTLGPVLRLSTGREARVMIDRWTKDSLRAVVDFKE